MKRIYVSGIILLCFLIGCQKMSEVTQKPVSGKDKAAKTISQKETQNVKGSQTQKKKISSQPSVRGFKPFYVYSDKASRQNHYVPSGFMPNGKCLKFSDVHKQDCLSGQTCIQIIYDVECSREGDKWAGIYWLNPANNWGNRKGGYNLTGAQRLTFWAKGKNGGEQIQEVTIGGITGDYPDSDIAVIGPIILSNEWKQYTVDLRGKDLSYISGGFSWTTSEEVNPTECIFYLDEMKFE